MSETPKVEPIMGPMFIQGSQSIEWSNAMDAGFYTTMHMVNMPGAVLEFHNAQGTLWALCDVRPKWWQVWRKRGLQWFEVKI